jgi:hypothetical protein
VWKQRRVVEKGLRSERSMEAEEGGGESLEKKEEAWRQRWVIVSGLRSRGA